jgi:uncharacterized membrane protein YedE/YeeE
MGAPESFWPAWLGAGALGGLTILFWLAVRRPLGISGIWGRFLRFEDERRVDRAERLARERADELRMALELATAEAMAAEGGGQREAAPVPTAVQRRALGPRPTLGAHGLFLVGLVLGGVVSARLRGGAGGPGLGPAFEATFGAGPRGLLVLLGGGLLVGFGTTLAGGCPSGHGLSGCSRGEPGSLAAAASFLGAAVAVTLLLARLAP